MLTLKVVTLDQNNDEQTSLFYGDSISHAEGIMKGTELKNYPDSRWVGYIDSASEQPFMASHVLILNADTTLKHDLLVLPKSDCYVTESGKTVDTFYSYFKEV
ncbi:MAG: hypothetical protein JJE45_00175 [Prolixibacteraceae bacterium]|nr:hypothetical protein [Prolixibacteraceae bacterium]